MAYSKELREKVLEYMAEGRTQEETARVFRVSVSAIKEWKNLRAETGCLSKRELNRQPRKYTSEKIAEIFAENPNACLSEIAGRFENGSVSGLLKALGRMKIRVKRN